jgi:hypothetical protein
MSKLMRTLIRSTWNKQNNMKVLIKCMTNKSRASRKITSYGVCIRILDYPHRLWHPASAGVGCCFHLCSGLLEETRENPVVAPLLGIQRDPGASASGPSPNTCVAAACDKRSRARKERGKGSHGHQRPSLRRRSSGRQRDRDEQRGEGEGGPSSEERRSTAGAPPLHPARAEA